MFPVVLCCVRLIVEIVLFFFSKQKTAYEMRISDWSSDVCSSELAAKARITFDDLGDGVVFLGLMGFIDPPREEAKAAIAECRSAGIAVKMIKIGRASCRERVCQYV